MVPKYDMETTHVDKNHCVMKLNIVRFYTKGCKVVRETQIHQNNSGNIRRTKGSLKNGEKEAA